MATEFKIEKGVEIPKQRRASIWADLAQSMEVGDSVLVNSRNETMSLYSAG